MMKAGSILLCLILCPLPSMADCFEEAAERYQVSAKLLQSIAWKESRGRLDAIGKNKNGSEDLCAMQINTSWLPKLASYGYTRKHLLTNQCACIYAGAWILAGEIQAVGNRWKAVARYHTGPRIETDPAVLSRGIAYASDVRRIFNAYIGGKG